MKSFKDLTTPVSSVVVAAPFLVAVAILFRPDWFKFFAVVLPVDTLASIVGTIVYHRVLKWRYPEVSTFFPKEDLEAMSRLSEEGKETLLRELLAFPSRKANWSFWLNLIKIIPAGLLMVYYIDHQCSNLEQALRFVGLELMIQPLFYGLIFLDNHRFVSKKIVEYHEKLDLSRAFRAVKLPKENLAFSVQETICLSSILLFSFVLQIILILTGDLSKPASLILEMGVVCAFSIFSLSWLWRLTRVTFFEGLQHVVERVGQVGLVQDGSVLPLNSNGALARVGQAVNQLSDRLRKSERELSNWLIKQTEESRYRTIGEISGLVAHDLAGPFQTLHFCVDLIKKTPDQPVSPDVLRRIDTNVERGFDLVRSLRAHLKDSQGKSQASLFGDAHQSVLRLLATQFQSEGFVRLRFNIDDRLLVTKVPFSQTDWAHVLYNLYRNSVENLLRNDVVAPEINVTLAGESKDTTAILITDSGTGLSPDRFEQLTGDVSGVNADEYRGLGLRLIRRLIERKGGKLSALDSEKGSRFLIVVPAVAKTAAMELKAESAPVVH